MPCSSIIRCQSSGNRTWTSRSGADALADAQDGTSFSRSRGNTALLAPAAPVAGVTGISPFSGTESQSRFGTSVSHSLGLFSDSINVGAALLHKALQDLVGLCHSEPSVPSPLWQGLTRRDPFSDTQGVVVRSASDRKDRGAWPLEKAVIPCREGSLHRRTWPRVPFLPLSLPR